MKPNFQLMTVNADMTCVTATFPMPVTAGNRIHVRVSSFSQINFLSDSQGNTFSIVRQHKIGKAFGIRAVSCLVRSGIDMITVTLENPQRVRLSIFEESSS